MNVSKGVVTMEAEELALPWKGTALLEAVVTLVQIQSLELFCLKFDNSFCY